MTIQGGGELLWQGSLLVSRNQPARITHSVQQAQTLNCAARPVPSYGSNGTGFTMMISERRVSEAEEAVEVTAEWTRIEGKDCATQASRKVEVRGTMTLAPGEQGKLTGDAGLIVTLRQRGA